jgi:mannose-6-phosphate isomerase
VLAAEPGATLGIGFREPVDTETMRAAALDGRIEDMLVWHEVSPGDSSTSRPTRSTRLARA